jgi:hypothetical protein
MEIDEKIETPVGTVVFKGKLDDEELRHVIRAGLMYLMASGYINTSVEQDETLLDPPETLQ